jgi:TetR/AcrR family transcriptional regulator, transcriptional repressor for nem operon
MSNEPTTARGRASRERIVTRVADFVAEHGVRAVSLEQVLAAAGASKSQLSHYFGGREQLMEAAVAHRCEQVLSELTRAFADVATLEGLEDTLGGFVALYEQTLAGCPIGTLAGEVAEGNEGARLQVVGAFAAWERLFADAFERMRQQGCLHQDAVPADLATALLASLEGGMLLSQTRRDATSLRIAVAASLAYLRSLSP